MRLRSTGRVGGLEMVRMTVASLSITQPGLAVLAGPVTVTTLDPVTGAVTSTGGYTATMVVNDGGTAQPDSFAITVLDAASNLWHQAGTTAAPLPVAPGSIIITPKL